MIKLTNETSPQKAKKILPRLRTLSGFAPGERHDWYVTNRCKWKWMIENENCNS